ncbi:hypothetical protein SDC9_202646 [bioreactor metagenome]|uniref:Uncharacterized protein n=1 Tax=bioreactor metagenome TaxID=1076179 RepID=A0A645IV00_9ZZZZ
MFLVQGIDAFTDTRLCFKDSGDHSLAQSAGRIGRIYKAKVIGSDGERELIGTVFES